MPARGLRSCFDHRWGWSRGGGGGVRVVGGDHAGENWCDGGRGSRLGRRGVGLGRGRRRGPMRNEEGPAVHSRCGYLVIAWFGVTWKQKRIRVDIKRSS